MSSCEGVIFDKSGNAEKFTNHSFIFTEFVIYYIE